MSRNLTEAIVDLFGNPGAVGTFVTPDPSSNIGFGWGTPTATDNDLDHTAQKLGLVGAPFDPYTTNHTDLGLSSGYAIGMLIRPGNTPITNLGMWLAAAGTGSSGENKMFIMDETFTVLGKTADISTDLSDNSNNGKWVEWPIVGGPIQGVKGTNYFVAALCHMSVNPTVGGILDGSGVAVPKFKTHWPAVEFEPTSTVPTSFNPANVIPAPAVYFFAAS